MRLLISDADQLGELLLGHPKHDAVCADPRTDVNSGIVR
jgi:hypothetical protein